MRLILASASPRRAELLRAAGLAFDVSPVDVDERIRADEPAATYVRRLAAEKSAAAMSRVASGFTPYVVSGLSRTGDGPSGDGPPGEGPPEGGHYVVLGADTAVVVDGEILGKPRDDGDAAAMLGRLSGRWHEVMTGVSVRRGAVELGRVDVSRVQFAPLGDADVRWYVESGEGCDKAGAYAIQGLASRFIPRIDGSYSNVVGLPVTVVIELLKMIETSYSHI